jgi:hypothetical protein
MRDSDGNLRRIVPMGLAFAAAGILGAALWLSGATSWFSAAPEPERQMPQRLAASVSGPAGLLAVAPADLPAAVRDRYRLRPDRRLLAAVAAVHRLRGGAAPADVTAEFREGRWRILAGGEEVGTLAEIPSFEEANDLLARWAGRSPQTPAATGGPDAGKLERALREIDTAGLLTALSSPGGSQHSIAQGLAWLSTLTVDHLEQADALLAEAWAWTALERAGGATGGAGSEALVARALGYEAAAGRASAKLAADDPVRLYALGDEPRLDALCAKRATDRPCHFLHLALLAERDQGTRFRSVLLTSPFQGETSLALLGLATRLSDFDARTEPGHDLAELALRTVSPSEEASTAGEASTEARTRDFEAAVERLASRGNAGPVGVAAIQAAYRAAFYSGLFQEARFTVGQLASGPAAQELAASFVTPAAGTAEELRRWIEVSGKVLEGSREMRPLAEMLESSRSIGAKPLFDLGASISRLTASTDPWRRRPLPALFARLDTRPSHLVLAARVARRQLVSPWLFERFARAAVEAAPHRSEELPALAARLREDAARSRATADDPAMPKYAQTVALSTLAKLGKADDAFVRTRYEAVAADPDEGTAPLIDFLETRGDLAGASAAVEAAIRRERPGGLGLAHLQTELARLRLLQGDPERASAALQPALPVGKEETLLQGARIELARNRPESALALAQAALARYPERSSETSGLIARARWQLKDYTTAAQELAASRNGIVGPWNRHLPEAFAESFATAPEVVTRQAFNELAAAGIAPHVLADVAIALGRKRGIEIVQPLLATLRAPAPEWQDHVRLATYDLLREKAGADAALAWIRAAVPGRSHELALSLYQERRYDLLLGLYPNGEEGGNPRLVRMVKAAALLHLRETRGPRWDGLAAEVASDAADDFFANAARYLVGRSDAAALLRPLPDAGYLASVGWLMGVKAASERRFADADGWFQVALESGQQQQPPHAWSWVIENEWLQAERSLEILEKKGESWPSASGSSEAER